MAVHYISGPVGSGKSKKLVNQVTLVHDGPILFFSQETDFKYYAKALGEEFNSPVVLYENQGHRHLFATHPKGINGLFIYEPAVNTSIPAPQNIIRKIAEHADKYKKVFIDSIAWSTEDEKMLEHMAEYFKLDVHITIQAPRGSDGLFEYSVVYKPD